MLKILEKTANYAYDWKCEFNDVEFLEEKFSSSDWSPVHDAVTQLSLSQRIILLNYLIKRQFVDVRGWNCQFWTFEELSLRFDYFDPDL